MTLDDVVDLAEAGSIMGVRPQSVKAAIARGSLAGKYVGPRYRGVWVTTVQAIAAYQARKDIRRAIRKERSRED